MLWPYLYILLILLNPEQTHGGELFTGLKTIQFIVLGWNKPALAQEACPHG